MMKGLILLILAMHLSLVLARSSSPTPQLSLSDNNSPSTGCPPTAKKLFALPGNGFCGLRNIELNPVFAITYNKCQLVETYDGDVWLIPDHLHLIPKSKSDVETSAEIIDHFHNYTDITSSQMGASVTATIGLFNIGGSYSSGYKHMKKSQVEDKSVTTRVTARYVLFSARLDEYSVELDTDLKLKLNDAIAALQVGNETRASLISEMTVLSHGTHCISGVDLGGALVKEDYISQAYRTLHEMDQHTVTISASIGFSNFFGAKASYSTQDHQAQYDEYVKSITSTRVKSHGGILYKPNSNISTWVDSVSSHLVTVDRSGLPLHYLITPRHFPHANQSTLSSLRKNLLEAINQYYQMNLRTGCMDPTARNFDYNANVGDKSCHNPPTNYTFGGVYQSCGCTDSSGTPYYCAETDCKPYIRNNYLTGSPSCPEHYAPVFLNTKSFSNCWESCSGHWFWRSCEKNCDNFQYKTYWCAALSKEEIPKNSGLMFGGLYTSTANNPVTNGKSCPPFYRATQILQDLTVCSSADYEPGYRYSVPFGGFFSCTQGNPLALPPSLLAHAKPTCADGYSQHAAAIDYDCLINYCVKANSFGGGEREIPIVLPPFQNYDALFAEPPYYPVKGAAPMEGGSIAAIVLGVVLALLLMAIVIILFVIPRCRARRPRSNDDAVNGGDENVPVARPWSYAVGDEGYQRIPGDDPVDG